MIAINKYVESPRFLHGSESSQPEKSESSSMVDKVSTSHVQYQKKDCENTNIYYLRLEWPQWPEQRHCCKVVGMYNYIEHRLLSTSVGCFTQVCIGHGYLHSAWCARRSRIITFIWVRVIASQIDHKRLHFIHDFVWLPVHVFHFDDLVTAAAGPRRRRAKIRQPMQI